MALRPGAHASRINAPHNCADKQTHQFNALRSGPPGCQTCLAVTFGLRERAELEQKQLK